MQLTQWLKYVVHNCIVHPILPFVSKHTANTLHNKNADWAFKMSTKTHLKKTEVLTFLDELETERQFKNK